MKRIMFVVAMALCLAACATQGVRTCEGDSPAMAKAPSPAGSNARHEEIRSKIRTRVEFHHAAIAPEAYQSNEPLFLIGLEKPRAFSRRPYCASGETGCNGVTIDPEKFDAVGAGNVNAVTRTRQDIRRTLFQDPRSLVVTHMVRTRWTKGDGSFSTGGCYVFNVYGLGSGSKWCDNSIADDVVSPEWTRSGWFAFDKLRLEIEKLAKQRQATHLVFLATGWNTDEYESYRDFVQWMDQIGAAAKGREYRPIYIGVAWESKYNSVPNPASFTTKGNDADEIAFSWANRMLNDILLPLAADIGTHVVGIGHSFGARIVFGSHYVRSVQGRQPAARPQRLTLIGLQAAFPIGRFITQQGEEHQYLQQNLGTATAVITSSEFDQANERITLAGGYAGGKWALSSIRQQRRLYADALSLREADSSGKPKTYPDETRVSIYDASAFVNCQLQGTTGGAHSDVYDAEMGRFIAEVLFGR
ncbi:hypothetical protein BURK2_01776 [Burkholderiales bacterium]|nr:hypothetical protein BURK2_01776 [Burkholderiales bacterium]